MVASVLALSLAAAPSADPIQGRELQANLADYVDRTVTISDQFGGLSSHYFSSSHKAKGFRPSSHYGVRLWGLGIPAFVAKTAKNKALLEDLKSGEVVTRVGVVEAYRIDGHGFTGISIVIPDRDIVLFNVKASRRGAALAEPVFLSPGMVKAGDCASVEPAAISLEPVDYLANDVVVEGKLGHHMHIMKTFTSWERKEALNKESAIKIGIDIGFPIFIERTKENLEAVKRWRKGAHLRLYGNVHVEQRPEGDYPVLVVHKYELVDDVAKPGVTEL